MTTLYSIATVDELAARVGKTHGEALALLKKLRVPVTDGVFSDRLLQARLEQGARKAADPVDAACDHLAHLGFVIEGIDAGRPNVLKVGASVPLLIGSRECSTDASEGAFARISLKPGEHLRCVLQVARRRAGSGADFNIRFDRTRKKIEPDLYIFYLVTEDALWIVKPAEFEFLRADGGDRSKVGRSFAFFPVGNGDTWRLSFGKGRSDLDSDYRVERVSVPPAGRGRRT